MIGKKEVLSERLSQFSVEDSNPTASFLDLLTIPELPPPKVRHNHGQEIASRLCITTDEYVTFLKEQCLASEAKLEVAKKRKEHIALKKKKRLEIMALKKLEIAKKKEETKRKQKEMKLHREATKLAWDALKAQKGARVVSKSLASSSHDSIHMNYRATIKLAIEQELPPPLPLDDV